jgi:hypothetical protein
VPASVISGKRPDKTRSIPQKNSMNLQVNLILESERRSASRVSKKFLLVASVLFAASVFLLYSVIVLIGAQFAKQKLYDAERENKQLEPLFRQVCDLQRELTKFQNLTNEIAAWADTRPRWPGLLQGIQSSVSPNIQLTRLTVNESIVLVDNMPVRKISLFLHGKAAAESSEIDVQQLENDLKTKPPFDAIMERAEVKQFESLKNQSAQNMRAFDIECRFKPLTLFRPVPEKPQATKQ